MGFKAKTIEVLEKRENIIQPSSDHCVSISAQKKKQQRETTIMLKQVSKREINFGSVSGKAKISI